LYVSRADGSGALRQLTDDPATDRVPRWSPDGEWIAMFSDRTNQLQVWMIRPDGSDLRQITRNTSSVVAWSPDGRRLAVTRQRSEIASILDPRAPLEPEAAPDREPMPAADVGFAPNSWSPDGNWLAGQSGFTTPGIVIQSVASGRLERVTDFGEWPVWLPDSRRVLFVARGREFHVFDTRTKKTALIYSTGRDTLGPPRLTRDGRAMFYSRRITEADVWVATLR
jgi:Tol biopolymer transport system component